MSYEITIRKDGVNLTSFGRSSYIFQAITAYQSTWPEDFVPLTTDQLEKASSWLDKKRRGLQKDIKRAEDNIERLSRGLGTVGEEVTSELLDGYILSLNEMEDELDKIQRDWYYLDLLIDVCETPGDYDNWDKKPVIEYCVG